MSHIPSVQVRSISQPREVRDGQPVSRDGRGVQVGRFKGPLGGSSGQGDDVGESELGRLGTEENGRPEQVEAELSVVKLESVVGLGADEKQ